jgi:hypothetical protein
MINEVKRVRQEDHEFKASLGYTLKKKKNHEALLLSPLGPRFMIMWLINN